MNLYWKNKLPQHRLKSFTLLELLIGMLISSLVIGASIMAYQLVSSQFGNYRKVNTVIREAHQLHSLLQYDASRSERVQRESNELIFILAESPAIRYSFHEKEVWRMDHHLTDTFHLAAVSLTSAFQEEEREQGLIDQFSFESSIFDETERFIIRKQYDAQKNMEEARP
jgi:hypothetical protein